MQLMPIDVTALVAVILGCSMVLIPIIGITARFALKPTVEALSRFFESRGRDEAVAILERRVAFLEQQMEFMDDSVRRIEEVSSFHAQLEASADEPPAPVAP
jgi:hypothetical protein